MPVFTCSTLDLIAHLTKIVEEGEGRAEILWQIVQRREMEEMLAHPIAIDDWGDFVDKVGLTFKVYSDEIATDLFGDWRSGKL